MISFADFKTRNNVCDLLACRNVLAAIDLRGARSFYQEIRIPKKARRERKSFRVVYKVTDRSLASVQKNISSLIGKSRRFSGCVHGFTQGRSVVTNARQHLDKKRILHLDIKDFFPSINQDRVRCAFEKLGCGYEAADALATLCTLDGRLVLTPSLFKG